jgi:hypothetical protein
VLLPGVVNAGNFVHSLSRTCPAATSPAPSLAPTIPTTTQLRRAVPCDLSPGLCSRLPQAQSQSLLRRGSSLSDYDYDPTVDEKFRHGQVLGDCTQIFNFEIISTDSILMQNFEFKFCLDLNFIISQQQKKQLQRELLVCIND